MIQRLKSAWARHPVMTAGFLAAVALTILFAIRSTVFLIYWSAPEHFNQPVEGWMTPRYIMHSWQLSPEDVMRVIGDGPMPPRRHTLEEIAADSGIPLSQIIDNLTKALEQIEAQRAAQK
ncbi:MAG: hypothetical protein ACU0CA_05770 [Paracoccaceae bacterium]